jgi:hypothetical protein
VEVAEEEEEEKEVVALAAVDDGGGGCTVADLSEMEMEKRRAQKSAPRKKEIE